MGSLKVELSSIVVVVEFNDVVCGVLARRGRVLLVHRSAERAWAPRCWDAPGGHVEPGESDLVALARELREEIGIEFDLADAHLVAHMTGVDFDLRVFAVDSWSGEPTNLDEREHDRLAWFTESELSGLRLADAAITECLVAAIRSDGEPNATASSRI